MGEIVLRCRVLYAKAMEKTFTVHSSKNDLQSSVWSHFLVSKTEEAAKCKKCGKLLKAKGGSTKGLHTHLKLHDITVRRPPENEHIPNKIPKLTTYYKSIQSEEISYVLARLVALDGLSFSVIVNSIELRKSLEARKFKVPTSASTVKNIVMKCYTELREKVSDELLQLKKENQKFSLSFDEWTSKTNKRFINIIIHGNNKFWNTGLVRIKNSLNAENCIKLVEDRVQEFKLDLSSDFIAVTTDGASTMRKVGRLIKPQHQLCLAHGIQLAVLDVLYAKEKETTADSYSDDEDDDDIDSDSSADYFDVFYDDDFSPITNHLNLNNIIEKVRKIVRLFRKSPQKNEILQNYIKMDFAKELNLILDCKTRWNSLISMLERFLYVEGPLKKAAVDLHIVCLENYEYDLLKEVTQSLKPVELALKALCRREATLTTADAAINFMLQELKKMKYGLSKKLYSAVQTRVLERRTVYTGLLNFLTKGVVENSALEPHLTLRTIQNEIIELIKTFHTSNHAPETDVEIEIIENDKEESLQNKLETALLTSQIPHNSSASQSLSKVVSQEINLFCGGANRGSNLELAYKFLITVPPTSVECERCFSTSGLLCSKIRSKLADGTLDALVFLKHHFKNN